MPLSDLMAQLESNAAAAQSRIDETDAALANAGAAEAARRRAAASAVRSHVRGGNGGGPGTRGYTGPGGNVSSKGVDPYAGMVTKHFHGMSYQVNSTVDDRFQGFLRDLYRKTGYLPSSIGGYANRNIAGTSTKSLHSYGLAMDIDPSKNPVSWNGRNVTALPKGVGRLARRHGLVWGGNWNGSKRDPMHFSVPFFGTK